MIERGEAYVDPSPADEQQKGRFARLPSAYREAPVGESLRLFGEMLAGSEEGARCCVRAKMDFASDNGTLRDPTTFRTNATPHHATGSTFRAYPTYDFACPWVDAHEGVTHALRDRQYKDRRARSKRGAGARRGRPCARARALTLPPPPCPPLPVPPQGRAVPPHGRAAAGAACGALVLLAHEL